MHIVKLKRWGQMLRIIGNSWKKNSVNNSHINRGKVLFPSGRLKAWSFQMHYVSCSWWGHKEVELMLWIVMKSRKQPKYSEMKHLWRQVHIRRAFFCYLLLLTLFRWFVKVCGEISKFFLQTDRWQTDWQTKRLLNPDPASRMRTRGKNHERLS